MPDDSDSDESDLVTRYRDWLMKADHRASQAFDKAVMTLAGGALAISFAFLKDLVPSPEKNTLLMLKMGWGALALSLLFTFTSLWTSQRSLRRAMNQLDADSLKGKQPGGAWSLATEVLNIGAGLAFVMGVAFLIWFAVANLSRLGGT